MTLTFLLYTQCIIFQQGKKNDVKEAESQILDYSVKKKKSKKTRVF
jgi:hypothetical protein